MPALYIKEPRVVGVELGMIKQTVRRKHSRAIKLGDKLYLYADNRSHVRKRLRSTKCDDVLPIFIDSNKSVILGSRVLTEAEKHRLALDEGYGSFIEMFKYFNDTGGLPLSGQLIRWL